MWGNVVLWMRLTYWRSKRTRKGKRTFMIAVGVVLYRRADVQCGNVPETSNKCPCCPGATEGALNGKDFTL